MRRDWENIEVGHETDDQRLRDFGYRPQFQRVLSLFGDFSLGYSYMSPIAGFYALFAFALATGGPSFFWTMPIVLLGMLFVTLVFAEASSQYPIAGGVYQWARRIGGPRWGFMTGWMYLLALLGTNAGLCAGVSAFIAALLGIEATPVFNAVAAMALLVVAIAPGSLARLASPTLAAQTPTFKTTTKVVSLFATVFDANGRLVPDLQQEDFEVFDNEKPQSLVLFDNKIQPISVVVLLDTSLSMTGSIKLLQQAAEQFVMRLLPDDNAKVGAFNDKIEVSHEFTNKRDALISAVKDLDFGNATRLWDALAVGLDELKGLEGRRVILVFTDGDDAGSKIGVGHIIDRARAEEVMIYAVGLESRYFDGVRNVRTRPDRGLKRLADETGGGFFELEEGTELASTFTKVAQELHSQYVLAFEPQLLDGKVHKLAVRMKKTGLIARARKSYLADREAGAPRR